MGRVGDEEYGRLQRPSKAVPDSVSVFDEPALCRQSFCVYWTGIYNALYSWFSLEIFGRKREAERGGAKAGEFIKPGGNASIGQFGDWSAF